MKTITIKYNVIETYRDRYYIDWAWNNPKKRSRYGCDLFTMNGKHIASVRRPKSYLADNAEIEKKKVNWWLAYDVLNNEHFSSMKNGIYDIRTRQRVNKGTAADYDEGKLAVQSALEIFGYFKLSPNLVNLI